jgi:hypothetical protein
MEEFMDHPLYLAMVIAVIGGFGCVLGFVSFEETRARRRAEKEVASSNAKKVSGEVAFSK